MSYRRLDGITYTVCPGEWVCRVKELQQWFRVHFQHQAIAILDSLQKLGVITYTRINRGLVKYSIMGWRRHNTVLDYNCPCQKESGFFFLPIATAAKLIQSGPASEMDVVLDLWISAIYQDERVAGSDLGPVVYFRNGTGNPLVNYSELAQRWGHSRSTIGRMLKKLAATGYLELMAFPGRSGSVIYLKSYLSTMFQISDVLVDKEEVALRLNIVLRQTDPVTDAPAKPVRCRISVSNSLPSVSKTSMETAFPKVAQLLAAQGISCLNCPESTVKLYSLSGDCKGNTERRADNGGLLRLGMDIFCHSLKPIYRFELSMIPISAGKGGAGHGEKSY